MASRSCHTSLRVLNPSELTNVGRKIVTCHHRALSTQLEQTGQEKLLHEQGLTETKPDRESGERDDNHIRQ